MAIKRTDPQIHSDVLAELRWDPRVDETEVGVERHAEREARYIRIELNDGNVQLSGPVHSWAERQAVCSAARFTPGVRTVDDRLYVDVGA